MKGGMRVLEWLVRLLDSSFDMWADGLIKRVLRLCHTTAGHPACPPH